MGSVDTDGARRIARARAKYDEWYERLVAAIREETGVNVTTAADRAKIGRSVV